METNNTITMDDLMTIFISTAHQMDTMMFMSLIGTTIDEHCSTHEGLKNVDFVDELKDVMLIVNDIIANEKGDE